MKKNPKTPKTAAEMAAHARARTPFQSLYLDGYLTTGGTYMIATAPRWTDNGKPRDLAAILPAPLEGTRVVPMYVAVDPDLINELRELLD